MSSSETTTDHDVIRKWIEKRGGVPTVVRGTEGEDGEGRSGRRRPQLIEDDGPDVDDFDEGPGPVKREPRGTARSRASASAAPRNSRGVDSGDEVDDDGDAAMEQW